MEEPKEFRKCILLIDDDRSIVRILEIVLQREGYAVLTAFDGSEGVQKACEEKPDLIILDVVMPGMDGYEVCQCLQARRDTAAIPVIMLTAKGDIDSLPSSPEMQSVYLDRLDERMEGFEAGAVGFLSKPILAKEVIAQVKKVPDLFGLV